MKNITLLLIFLVSTQSDIFGQSTASYDINFTSTWNTNDHGTLPTNAHWSDLVGVNHNSNVTFWEEGELASPGIEDVAESGINATFNAEVQTAINAGNAQQWLREPFSPFAAISSATLTDVLVSEDYPLLTLVSMIAPSPDWIIALNSLSLWDNNTNSWKDTFTIDLFPYDAGTEDGYGYSTSNPATVPQENISSIAGASGYPFNSEKIGTLTITLKAVTLSVDDFNTNTVKLYPNPNATEKLTISNASALEDISIYNILGKRVKQEKSINGFEDQITTDISDLNDSIYIVKLTNSAGVVESKRLIIN